MHDARETAAPKPAAPSRPTDNLRRQHEELFAEAGELLAALSVDTIAANAHELRRRLARFSGKLSVHASMENDALYPRMVAHPDPRVSTVAREFVEAFGGIYDAFSGYLRRWPTAASIEGNPVAFVRESKDAFKMLARRVMRETSELYPLADEVL